MTRKHRLDARVARLAAISDEQAAPLAGLTGHEALLEEITRMPTTDPARAGRRRRRVPLVVGAAAIVVVGGTAAGWALVTSSAHDTVSIECVITGTDTIIPAESGNAVRDCAAQWQRDTNEAAPPLAAYDNGLGGITVQPARETPSPGFTRVRPATSQNVTVIDLQESLDDYVHGLNSACYDNAAATAIARTEFTTLGLTGWTVVPATPDPTASIPTSPQPVASPSPGVSAAPGVEPGSEQCVNVSIVDPAAQTVTLQYSGVTGSANAPFLQLAAKLRSIASRCQPLGPAAGQVRAAASELGLSVAAHDYELTTVPQPTAACTVIHETVGGTIFLTLRGPAT